MYKITCLKNVWGKKVKNHWLKMYKVYVSFHKIKERLMCKENQCANINIS